MRFSKKTLPAKKGYYKTIKRANEFGIPVEEACNMRMRYLKLRISGWKARISPNNSEMDYTFIKLRIRDAQEEINFLAKRAKPPLEIEGQITDAQISRANEYPIDSLIEFIRGRAIAFCHESDTHSMKHNTRDNKAHCFVCNKGFSPIDTLMVRDGYNFIEAVKQLQ